MVMRCGVLRWAVAVVVGLAGPALAQAPDTGQAPYGYDMPPRRQEAPDTSIAPLNKPLEIGRAHV